MEQTLLATKLRVPPQPPRLLQRATLVDTLERGVPNARLALLSAPAGYGKTTLLAQWARASRLPVAWLSASANDREPAQFFRCLLTAWDHARPGVRASSAGLLLDHVAPDMAAVLVALVNLASASAEPLALVIDDVHLIDHPGINEGLTFLIDHLPPTHHVVLASRVEPALPLARYRARQSLLELRAADLQFRPAETLHFLNDLMGLTLSEAAVATIQSQLEGWAAGLQLAALSLIHRPDGANQAAISGQQRFIADYLRDDVLAALPDATRQFLLETSILDRLCGAVCDEVTGRSDSQAMLERLERENLFLQPLDDRREWFRYHPLFSEFLRAEQARRSDSAAVERHRRAAVWHLAQRLPEQALRHAIQASDAELAAQIGDQFFELRLLGGDFITLQRWLDAIPSAWHASHPEIGLVRAGFFMYRGALKAGARCVDEVEAALAQADRADKEWQQARVSAVRCAVACFADDLPQARAYADSADQNMPAEDHAWRAVMAHALGDTYRRNGFWDDARRCYLKVLELHRAPAFPVRSVHAYGALADLELEQGHLRNAATYWRKALATIEDRASWGRFPLPLTGWVYLRLGEILYEWNQTDAASDLLAHGLERSRLSGDLRAQIAAHLLAGRLQLAAGELDQVEHQLDLARPLVEQAGFSNWVGRFERLQLECWLARGQLRAAVLWADALLADTSRAHSADAEAGEIAVARMLIVAGDLPSLDRALAMLGRLLETAEAAGRAGVQVEALALLALNHRQRGDQIGALTALERALRLAEPEGYARLWVDLGLPMARLLQEARARNVMPEYVATLLAAFGNARAEQHEALAEPLTEREQEVLGLLAAGLTNREIAKSLFVSPETVKKHTSSIYGKLGVVNRTEAAARARELDLLA